MREVVDVSFMEIVQKLLDFGCAKCVKTLFSTFLQKRIPLCFSHRDVPSLVCQ